MIVPRTVGHAGRCGTEPVALFVPQSSSRSGTRNRGTPMLRARLATSLLAAGLGLACGCSNMSNFSLTSRHHRPKPCDAACVESGSPVCDGPMCDGPALEDFG